MAASECYGWVSNVEAGYLWESEKIEKEMWATPHSKTVERRPLLMFRGEQIIGTPDKPQCLVAQRLLSHLQSRDATKSSTKNLSFPPINLRVLAFVSGD